MITSEFVRDLNDFPISYVDCGALLLPGEALEILFIKQLV